MDNFFEGYDNSYDITPEQIVAELDITYGIIGLFVIACLL